MKLAAISLAAMASLFGSAGAAEPVAHGWAILARADLHAIHDILAANHPGPVDPQNPAYKRRLDNGLRDALARADHARGYGDYLRALKFYTNNFRDGHLVAYPTFEAIWRWPGFEVGESDDAAAHVVKASPGFSVPIGSALISCDGKSVDAMMSERVDPYYWNRDIPQARYSHLDQLFLSLSDEQQSELKSCRFRLASGEVRDVALAWSFMDLKTAMDIDVGNFVYPPPALRKVDDVWIISIPSFSTLTDEDTKAMQSLIADLKGKAGELQASTLVFDVRGNGGGNSAWGTEIAKAIWGDTWVDGVEGSLDWTLDYRVSPSNLAKLNETLESSEKAGLKEATDSWRYIRDHMEGALKHGDNLMRLDAPGTPLPSPSPPNPFHGRAFLLTDGHCASACLDFADLMLRLPGVTHIGKATSADAVYIDNDNKTLPSGLAGLSYSMKVFRHRLRANNQWYEPKYKWPGGNENDAAIAAWVKSLN